MDSLQPTVEEIFLDSLQKDPADRQAFLEQTCVDSNVRTRVEALLKAHDSAGNFLESPAVQPASVAAIQDPHAHASDANAARETLNFLDRCDTPGRLGLLAHYEIFEVLGSGGMGVVLRGLDVKLNRVVAIKVLAPQLAVNATARRRFLREAQAAAAVGHQHVVAIHAVDEFKGLPYLVMECISGSSLQQKINEGALEFAQVLRIGMQIASGLAAAHAQGLVHRDIKPANILLENGVQRVKITDFGLARSIDDVRLTQAGMVYGTPLYMSPEQAQGDRVDQRSDLFSLGSVMYAMCTGRPPFRGDTGLAVLKRVCDDTPRPIRDVNPDIPETLAKTVNTLLAKNPDARFQNAGEVADLLGQYLSDVQQHARVDSPGTVPEPVQGKRPKSEALHSRRWLMAVAASLVLFAGFGLTEAAGVTDFGGTVIRLFSPDGTLVVEVDDPGVSVRIDGEEIVITGTGAKEIRLKPGQYKVQASKDGKLVRQEIVAVTKNGRQVVRVSKEGQSVAIGNEPPRTPALQERKSAPYKNSIGMEFVRVPKGNAWLGGGEGRPGDKEVEIKEDFYLGKYEVTQEEWEQVMGVNPSHFSHAGAGKEEIKDVPAADAKRFPVELVSWDEAQVFLRLLNQRDKQKGWAYRLPTEVEWEYACRGGPLADRLDSAFDYYFDRPVAVLRPQQANYNDPKLNRSCQVGSYPPNKLGLCDMHGNVWEWCDDLEKGDVGEMNRVYRGGCWELHYECRATARLVHTSSMRNKHLGLRLARVPAATASVKETQDSHAATRALPAAPLVKAPGRGDLVDSVPPPARAPFDTLHASEHQVAWAKYLGVPVECTNKLGMKFRLIPPGEFTMGVTEAEAETWPTFHPDAVANGKWAAPAHPVRLTRPFYLGEREVRYGEFLDLMKREPGDQPKHPHNEPEGPLQTKCTWFDCIAFCNRLSEREGRTPAYQVAGREVTMTPDATGYRLPTEAEWEFACRAGTTSLWYFGLTAQEARAMSVRSIPEAQGYLRARTADCNPFGLFGMYAGAQEWCWDWYAPGYYGDCADRGVAVDPQGPDMGEARIIRGGAGYADNSGDLRQINSAARNPCDPRMSMNFNGFGRVVLPIPAKGRAGSAVPVLNR